MQQQNQAVSKTSDLNQSIVKVEDTPFFAILSKASFGGKCDFSNEDWIWIGNEIRKDFPEMTGLLFQDLITRGCKGEFGVSNFITLPVIYGWLNQSEYRKNLKKEKDFLAEL